MSYEVWYKTTGDLAYKVTNQFVSPIILNEPPDNSAKNGYHLVSKIDLPKPAGHSPVAPMLPRTLREIRNHPLTLDIDRYGRVVGQLLASGYVTSEQCLSLLSSLDSLAQEFSALRQELHQIPDDKLRLLDEAVDGRT